jgi:maleylpyruvate isomerase
VKLYNYFRSSASYRVRLALAHKQLAYEYVPVNLLTGEQRADDHRARNPRTTVPVLEDQGVFIAESVAIAEYLEETYPQHPLFPSTPVERAQVRSLAEMINSGIQPFHNAMVLKYVTDTLHADAKAWADHWVQLGLTAVEAVAAKSAGKFLVGDTFTWADCCLLPQLFGARRVSTVDPQKFPTLVRVEQTSMTLPAFALARPEAQPDAQP